VQAIARREMGIALRRRFVKLLFLLNLVPPLVMAVFLVIRAMVEGAGLSLGFDPLARFIAVQVGPVLFLALAIGTPCVARDRAEDVLFLYATRPVSPWSYTLGKMAAVAAPAAALLVIPGILIAAIRMGILENEGAAEGAVLVLKVLLVAALTAVGYAGVCVGASAATKKARWALLVALGALIVPRISSQLLAVLGGVPAWPLDAPHAVEGLVDALFDSGWDALATAAAGILLLWGALGAAVTAVTVSREMTP
jgi:ABC-type transport system involved in multi-copper enzyme maturation permease subunit